MGFVADDLRKTEDDEYGKYSMVWQTCNYLLYAEDSSKSLDWFPAEKVIDNKLAVLLIHKLKDKDDSYKALYVYKPRQIKSNSEMESQSFWKDVGNFLHSLVWGHPEVEGTE